MAVFADSLDLRTAVVEAVGGPEKVVDVWPRVLGLAEQLINRRARNREQLTEVTLTFADGAATLPTDFLEAAHFYDAQDCEMFENTLANARRSGSQYKWFAIDGSEIKVYGLSGDRTLEYYAKIPTITTALTATNWLLDDFPDVYLYAATVEAAKSRREFDTAQGAMALFEMAINEMAKDSMRAQYSRSVVRVQGVNP